jgi:hypothetical protein
MKIDFNYEKNELLKETRWVCFDDVVEAINSWNLIKVSKNDNYKNQRNFILKIKNYIYICPFVEDENWAFLKTVYPSRKHNKIYNS